MANKYSPSDSTLNGMIEEIHGAVNREYLSEKAKTQADKEHKEAKQLQVFLQNIKNYYSNIQSKKDNSYFNSAEWNEFFDFLNQNYPDLQGKLFRRKDTGKKDQHFLEDDLAKIVKSITQVSEKHKFFKQQNKNVNISVNLGQKTTNVGDKIQKQLYKFAKEQLQTNGSGATGQAIMEYYGVQTARILQEKGKTGLGLHSISVKIDTSGGYTNVTQLASYDKSKVVGGNIRRFAQLMLSASFSDKSYSTSRSGVGLETQNFLRILLDFLPQIDSRMKKRKELISFVYALANREIGNGDPPTSVDELRKEFADVDFIYRLTGRGQQINPDERQDYKDLNNFLRKGAKYLVYNEHNSDNIYVESTRYIIYEKFATKTYKRHSMTIAKGLIKNTTNKKKKNN